MTLRRANSITINNETYYNNQIITSVDCNNARWENDNMDMAFYNCHNLQNVLNIDDNVYSMDTTFCACFNLTESPILPTSLHSMIQTFESCWNLVNTPIIPNHVSIMSYTFSHCNKMTTAPIIPNSVTNMYGTFEACHNLTGDIYIHSENVANVTNCFMFFDGDVEPYLIKNVYIPYDNNGVNTRTYTSFIDAGYDEHGTKEGVYLKDINELY